MLPQFIARGATDSLSPRNHLPVYALLTLTRYCLMIIKPFFFRAGDTFFGGRPTAVFRLFTFTEVAIVERSSAEQVEVDKRSVPGGLMRPGR